MILFLDGGPSLYAAKRPYFRPVIFVLILASFLFLGCAAATNTNWPGISTDGKLVYVAGGTQIKAYDPATQQEVWAYPEEPGRAQFFAEPSVENGRLVIGDYGVPGGFFNPLPTVTLYGIDTTTNPPSLLWTNTELAKDRYVAPALQDNGRVFVGTSDNKVVALDVETGELLWPEPFETGHSIWGQPVLKDGVLYVSSLDRALHALDAENGTELQRWEIDGAIASRPLLGDEYIYVTSFDGKLHALNYNEPTEAWSVAAANWIWGGAASANGTVVFADVEGNVFAVDASTGAQKWQTQVFGAVQTRPVVVNDVVYLASEGDLETEQGALTAVSLATGDILWQQSTPAPLYTTPVVVEDTIIVALQSESALLIGYDLAAGSQRWVIAPPAN
ncbi:MAG: hypothetical protein D6835_02520 [Candidatus Thermofonsia bacterium]|nr:MAG: hypothetical protein D6835_02520 [Candidatus Thermofonsia bacterium]